VQRVVKGCALNVKDFDLFLENHDFKNRKQTLEKAVCASMECKIRGSSRSYVCAIRIEIEGKHQ
jgi:hypothetical protein